MPTTIVSDHTAILGTSSWAPETPNAPTILTYSFAEEVGETLFLLPSYEGFQPFTAQQEAAARDALETWAVASGLTFVEVEGGQSDLTFGNYDLPDGTLGVASGPLRSVFGSFIFQYLSTSSILIDTSIMNDDDARSAHVMLQQIGRALGLAGPDEGDFQLPDAEDNTLFTVMSNTGPPATELTAYDIAAISQLYGAEDFLPTDGEALQSFVVDENAHSTTQTWGTEASEIWGSSLDDHISGGAGDDTIADFSGNDLLEGGAGDDMLLSTDGADTLRGDAGNDVLFNFADGAVLEGGAGDDQLHSANGDSTLRGDVGNDLLYSYAGTSLLEGGAGFDTLYGASNDDTLFGGRHADLLSGQRGNDHLDGGHGVDVLYGGHGEDTLHAGSSADRVYGGLGDDLIFGGSNVGVAVDALFGEGGRDTIYGGTGFDVLDGGLDWDVLYGGHQADNLYGREDNDILFGGQGFDRLFGGTGGDTLHGELGDDALFGESGRDLMWGGQGQDRLFGGGGHDILHGGAGHDVLHGGVGNDMLSGNFNADTFVFEDTFGLDTITDFDANNPNEKIDFSAVSAITDFDDLMENHVQNMNWSVRINIAWDNHLLLRSVNLEDLDVSDFIF